MKPWLKYALGIGVAGVFIAATLYEPTPAGVVEVCGIVIAAPIVKRVPLTNKVGHAPDWRTGMILIGAGVENYEDVYRHELAHIVVDSRHGKMMGHVPEFYVWEAYLKGAIKTCPNA